MAILSREFYARPALEVARDLLGCRLVRQINQHRLSGFITETEAYQGETDLGCHAHVGRTPRTAIMYGQAGHAYIYFTYGMHWLFNVVTDLVEVPSAVLIRAIMPDEGQHEMALNRPYRAHKRGWLNGPAKLTQALLLDKEHNGCDLCTETSDLFIEAAHQIPDSEVISTARVGLNSVPEPWKSIPWRFLVKRNGAIS